MSSEVIRVLAVEDSPSDRELIGLALRQAKGRIDFHLEGATSLEDASRRLSESPFDVVLLDLNLPDSTGFQTFQNLAARFPEVAIVILSGQSDEDLAIRAVDAGAQDYIAKDRLGLPGAVVTTVRHAFGRYRVRRELQRAEARLRTVLGSTSDGIVIVDDQKAVLYANPSAQQLLEAYGSTKVLPFSFLVGHGQELPVEMKDGTRRYFLMNVSRTDWESVPAYCISLSDVTASRAAIENKVQFLARVSHDIRSPLNALMGAAALLRRTPLDAQQVRYVSLLEKGGATLRSLVNDLLDLAQSESGKITLDQRAFSLHELLDQLVQMMEVTAQEKGIFLKLEIGHAVPEYVVGDPLRLNQIFLNLVSNAIKFTERGGVVVRAKVVPGSGVVAVTVKDTGIGIPREDHRKIFQSYRQGSNHIAWKYGGSGLGLAIVKNLVDLVGGSIAVESEPGKGSAFTVSLPLVATAAPDYERSLPIPPATDASLRVTPDLRILVADDCEISRTLIDEYFVGLPLAVDFVEDGELAVERFKAGDYDLVFLDMHMPKKSGLAAAAEMRAWESARRRRRTPIVALTAASRDAERRRFLAEGCDRLLPKPFTRESLLGVLGDVSRPRVTSA